MQSPSTLDIVLSNGLHVLDNLSTRAELSSDHLPVLFEVTSSQIDLKVIGFTTALLKARTTAVPKTVPFRYSLVLKPEIKTLIAIKKHPTSNCLTHEKLWGQKEL
jgi:hypothetical protein